jgi:hypothetical protein
MSDFIYNPSSLVDNGVPMKSLDEIHDELVRLNEVLKYKNESYALYVTDLNLLLAISTGTKVQKQLKHN